MSVDQIARIFYQQRFRIVVSAQNHLTSMRTNLTSMKKILVAAFALFMFSQCTEQEIVPSQSAAAPAEAVAIPMEASGSMTISGIFTNYEDIADCKTCTYVVPAGTSVVDGKELELKAGAVICLDKAIQYGDVDFINLEGTESHPIRIGTTTIK
jgi:hypothetical protein